MSSRYFRHILETYLEECDAKQLSLEQLVRSASQMLHCQIGNDALSQENPHYFFFNEEYFNHQARKKPATVERMQEFIGTIFRVGSFGPELVIITLIYVNRLIGKLRIPLRDNNWRPVFMGCLMLAQKLWDDVPLWPCEFPKLWNALDVRQYNYLETKIHELLDYKLMVKPSLYWVFYFELSASRYLEMNNGEKSAPQKPWSQRKPQAIRRLDNYFLNKRYYRRHSSTVEDLLFEPPTLLERKLRKVQAYYESLDLEEMEKSIRMKHAYLYPPKPKVPTPIETNLSLDEGIPSHRSEGGGDVERPPFDKSSSAANSFTDYSGSSPNPPGSTSASSNNSTSVSYSVIPSASVTPSPELLLGPPSKPNNGQDTPQPEEVTGGGVGQQAWRALRAPEKETPGHSPDGAQGAPSVERRLSVTLTVPKFKPKARSRSPSANYSTLPQTSVPKLHLNALSRVNHLASPQGTSARLPSTNLTQQDRLLPFK